MAVVVHVNVVVECIITWSLLVSSWHLRPKRCRRVSPPSSSERCQASPPQPNRGESRRIAVGSAMDIGSLCRVTVDEDMQAFRCKQAYVDRAGGLRWDLHYFHVELQKHGLTTKFKTWVRWGHKHCQKRFALRLTCFG